MPINTENLTKLIDHLKKVNKKNFDMRTWFDTNSTSAARFGHRPARVLVDYMQTGKGDCGTAACIAGHASLLSFSEQGKLYIDSDHGEYAEEEATAWLGLTEIQASDLFCPTYLSERTIPESLKVLEKLLETAHENNPVIHWEVPKRYRF